MMDFEQFQEIFNRLVRPLKNRILMLVARGSVELVTEGQAMQQLQVGLLADEVSDKIERIGHYGFTSYPKVGSECVVLFMGGNRDHGVAVSVDDRRVRLTDLAEGDVAVFTNSTHFLKMKAATKNIEAKLSKLKVQNDSDELIQVLSDGLAELISTVQAIIDARTETLLGPMPLLNVADPFPARKIALQAVKTRLDTFKV